MGHQLVHDGTVDEVTLIRRIFGQPLTGPVRLGTVRLAGGGLIVARLDGAAVGQRVRLFTDGGAPVAGSGPPG